MTGLAPAEKRKRIVALIEDIDRHNGVQQLSRTNAILTQIIEAIGTQ